MCCVTMLIEDRIAARASTVKSSNIPSCWRTEKYSNILTVIKRAPHPNFTTDTINVGLSTVGVKNYLLHYQYRFKYCKC